MSTNLKNAVKKIIRSLTFQKKIVTFINDALKHRIAKHVMNAHNELQKSTYYTLDAHGKRKHHFRRPSGSAGPISVYERVVDTTQQSLTFEQAEKHIYGSSRLGVMNVKVPLLGTQNNTYNQKYWSHAIGERTYEISNHLGNVLSVISDKPIPVDNGGMVDYYVADIRNAQDYSPFGVTLRERSFSLNGAGDYRYGFQGQEHDDEIKGKGNSYDFGARMYDSRLGRWLTIDPLANKYSSFSPYNFVLNTPIWAVDRDGRIVTFENSESEKTFNDMYALADDDFKAQLNQMKSSTVIFHVNTTLANDAPVFGNGQTGGVSYEFNKDNLKSRVLINVSGDLKRKEGVRADEMTAGYQ